MYDEGHVTDNVSAAEKNAMQGEVQLNIISEPMDHFTTFDDNYLNKLLMDEQKGNGLDAVILKEGMLNIVTEVMSHWYNIKGDELNDYVMKNFDKKWHVLDNRNKGQIEADEGMKFVRDFISGMVQL